VSSKFDVVAMIVDRLGSTLREGDVLVVSSKFLAISEGRVVRLRSVSVSPKAKELAARYGMDSRLCELVVRESDEVIGGVPGFLLTNRDGLLTPNAGIDKSNVMHGWVVLYPRRPEALAERIRESVKFVCGVSVGVVICDSRLSPTRKGTTGVTLAASGLEAILDLRGKRDLFGNVLKVTSQGVADDLSSAAELLMGESDEGVPMVIVRGLGKELLRKTEYPPRRFSIPMEACVYLRSLGYSSRRNTLLAM
jgi:coenzyme F420-0:L-glutamate ligase